MIPMERFFFIMNTDMKYKSHITYHFKDMSNIIFLKYVKLQGQGQEGKNGKK
jgi:hypothetical protein